MWHSQSSFESSGGSTQLQLPGGHSSPEPAANTLQCSAKLWCWVGSKYSHQTFNSLQFWHVLGWSGGKSQRTSLIYHCFNHYTRKEREESRKNKICFPGQSTCWILSKWSRGCSPQLISSSIVTPQHPKKYKVRAGDVQCGLQKKVCFLLCKKKNLFSEFH